MGTRLLPSRGTDNWCGRIRGEAGAFRAEATALAMGIALDGRRIAFSPSREELAIAEIAGAPILQQWRKTTPADEEVYGA